MTTETVLRKSWDLFLKHWQYLALVALVSFAINAVLAVIMGGSVAGGLGGMMAANRGGNVGMSGLFTAAGLASLGFGAIVTLLVTPLITGAMAHAGRQVVEGKTGSAAQPFQKALAQYGTYLLLAVILGAALSIGFTLLVIPGVILAVLLGLAPTIVAFEGAGVADALKKAWELGMKHFWTMLLVGVIIGVTYFVLMLVFALIPLVSGYFATLVATFAALALSVIYTEAK